MFVLDHKEYAAEAYSSSTNSEAAGTKKKKKKKKKSKNKRRFSDEQIKTLESMFETETRLETRKKLEVAQELGLQPRQVAIWFQNKRARCKSKQLERDFTILQSSYNNLASKFEAIKKERQALLQELQKLNDLLLQRPQDRQSDCCKQPKAADSRDSEKENADTSKFELEEKPTLPVERPEHVHGDLSDDEIVGRIKAEYFGLEDEPSLLAFVEAADDSLTSPEYWSAFESDDIFCQSNRICQWWDFWS